MTAAALPTSSAANNHSTEVALLSVLAVFIVLVLVKCIYLKYRRLHSIHLLPISYSPATTSDNSRPTSMALSISEKVEYQATRNSYLVGLLGSPDWETQMQMRLSKLAREEFKQRNPQLRTPRTYSAVSMSLYSSCRSDPSLLQSPSFSELFGASSLTYSAAASSLDVPEAAHVKHPAAQRSMSSIGDASLSSPTLCTSSSCHSLGNLSCDASSSAPRFVISRMSSLVSVQSRQSMYLEVPAPYPAATSSLGQTIRRPIPRTQSASPLNRASVIGDGKRSSYHKPTVKHKSSPSLRSAATSPSLRSVAPSPSLHSVATSPAVRSAAPSPSLPFVATCPSVRSAAASSDHTDEDKENQDAEFGKSARPTVSRSAVRKRGPARGGGESPSVLSKASSRRPFASIAQTLNVEPLATMPSTAEASSGSPKRVSAGREKVPRQPSPLKSSSMDAGATSGALHGLGLDLDCLSSCDDGCITMRASE
ncbi:hypothetical protein GLOTRDRAFT_134066 [Gloeophyllum trabeum ATCC 11539]|uniref:Uncharacterized protein n=1 Tax=Gloeophyllum trabeum (strain ATCC 11539 / FP-39264 / Madison 617) TaxID=670483 RepID=S7PSG3_GLOTA|nr:uncharacterized protein GLOTRDRAFT_134066 [Gloeophyllum trabeum ATCC 11539]EPQ50327.1 hypothetical protein GLOTRDRAFT_134066 [Gloeophyllum trabeum ATCC 11539]